jgi:hypothetical protein
MAAHEHYAAVNPGNRCRVDTGVPVAEVIVSILVVAWRPSLARRMRNQKGEMSV